MVTIKQKKCVLLSGGMDSTAALFAAIEEPNTDVETLSIRYGQKNADRELHAAGVVAGMAGVPWKQIDIADALLLGVGVTGDKPGPGNPAVLPGRNMALLSIAAAHCAVRWPLSGFSLVIGACIDDAEGFVDCRPDFLFAAQEALSLGFGRRISLIAPWVMWSKQEVLRRAWSMEARAAIRASWSCYEGGEKPCGQCGACVKRAVAFKAEGWVDAPLALKPAHKEFPA